MEQNPPKASEVGSAALEDLRNNFGLVQQITFPVIPILIVLGAADAVAAKYFTDASGHPEFGYYVFMIVYTLLTAWASVHYVMRWHLFSLTGSVEYKGGWLNPDTKYNSFFYKTLIIQAIVFATIMLPVFLMVVAPVIGLMVFIPLVFAGVYSGCRLSFILPATVLGHTPTIPQIWDFARGMVGKTIWAPIAATWKYIVAMFVYLFIIGFFVGFTSNGEPLSLIGDIFIFLFTTLPALLAGILFCLVYVGGLSRYYQWGLENRTDAYGDYK